MAVNVGLIPNYVSRGAIDDYLASIQGQYTPEQVNEIAQRLSANTAGVSFQELQARLAEGVAPQGGYTGGGGGYGGYGGEPLVEANLQDKINALNDTYNAIYGDLGTLAQERRGELEKSYTKSQGDLTNQYSESQRQLPQVYSSRGTRFSSYYDNALKKAGDVYNSSLEGLQSDRSAKLADIGKWYDTSMAGFRGAQQGLGSINPNFRGTQSDLINITGQLDNQLRDLGTQRAGFRTSGQYQQSLNSIAPAPNAGVSSLQKQLADLTGQSIPQFAKENIAKGYISQAGLPEDQKQYYEDYFQKQIGA